MMKTLKYIVLLTVMLVNVTPYIKDGKLEWKANEAAAQYYTIEVIEYGYAGNIWFCGNTNSQDTVISFIPCGDISYSNGEEAFYPREVCPVIKSTDYEGKNWCAFATLATLTCGNMCYYASEFYKEHYLGIDGCNSNKGVKDGGDLAPFYRKYLTLRRCVFNDEELIDELKAGANALVLVTDNHVYCIYNFKIKDNKVKSARKFDTEDSLWDRDIRYIYFQNGSNVTIK